MVSIPNKTIMRPIIMESNEDKGALQDELDMWRKKYFNLESAMAKLNAETDYVESLERKAIQLQDENN
jgi:hypothetical protein